MRPAVLLRRVIARHVAALVASASPGDLHDHERVTRALQPITAIRADMGLLRGRRRREEPGAD